MTGILAAAATASIRDRPPRGMIRWIYRSSCAISVTAARSVLGTSCAPNSGKPAFLHPSLTATASARLERIDSDPPLRITALPDFRQREAASLVTFGRDS